MRGAGLLGSAARLAPAMLAVSAVALAGAPANASDLRGALVAAYHDNPTLTGQRAQLRATDEGVPIARSAALPNVGGTASYSEFVLNDIGQSGSPSRSAAAGLNLTVPLYSGGAVKNGIRAAKARVDQGRASLRSIEAQVFVSVVGGYMDVIRDEAIVELNQGNIRVLQTNVQASSDRFQVGDLTRTDVAQSEARLAVARSQLQSAQAQLDQSRETYLRVVGQAPLALEPPPPLPAFPTTPDDAVDLAVDANPDLVAAKAAIKAAGYDVRVANANRLPKLSAFGSGAYTNYLGTLGRGISSAPVTVVDPTTGLPITVSGTAYQQGQTTGTIGVQATIPIFQGGLPAAQMRQAQAYESQAIEQETAIERSVVADARATYSLYLAAQGVIRSSEEAVKANELALEGVRAENSVGTRNVLDVLNAEQELLNSRVQLVTARRDAYVAGFALLAALGHAEAADLGLDGGPLYDPTLNYKRVHRKISDWSGDPTPRPVAARTEGVPMRSQVPLDPSALPQNQSGRVATPAATQPAVPPIGPVTSPR